MHNASCARCGRPIRVKRWAVGEDWVLCRECLVANVRKQDAREAEERALVATAEHGRLMANEALGAAGARDETSKQFRPDPAPPR